MPSLGQERHSAEFLLLEKVLQAFVSGFCLLQLGEDVFLFSLFSLLTFCWNSMIMGLVKRPTVSRFQGFVGID